MIALGCVREEAKDASPAERKSIPRERQRTENKTIPLQREQKPVKSTPGAKRQAALPNKDTAKKSLDGLSLNLIERLPQHAIDRGDQKALSEFAERARQSQNPAVRQLIVDKPGWFQEEALSDLLFFINDSDPSVAASALRQVDLAFEGVKNDRQKAALASVALAYAPDEMIEAFVSRFDDIEKESAVMRLVSLLDDYQDDPVVKDALLREYQFVTGEEFMTKGKAYHWVLDYKKTNESHW